MRIALVCDFYFPSVGGVEIHIDFLAKALTRRGHAIIVISHQYSEAFAGEKRHEAGFKVYYLQNAWSQPTNVIYPTFLLSYPEARRILKRESIEIVHCHQSTSTLGLEYGLYAKFMGLKVVHTEHSLFGFTSLPDIHLNKVISNVFFHYDRLIVVSRTTRNNLILRANLDP